MHPSIKMFITTFGFPKYVYHVSCSFLSNDFAGRGDFCFDRDWPLHSRYCYNDSYYAAPVLNNQRPDKESLPNKPSMTASSNIFSGAPTCQLFMLKEHDLKTSKFCVKRIKLCTNEFLLCSHTSNLRYG